MEIDGKSLWKPMQKMADSGNRMGEQRLKFILKSNETYAWIRSQGKCGGQSDTFRNKCFGL